MPFLQAVGRRRYPRSLAQQYFKLLGIPPLPEKGSYFISFNDFVKPLVAKKFPGSPSDGPPPGQPESGPAASYDEALSGLKKVMEKALMDFQVGAANPRVTKKCG